LASRYLPTHPSHTSTNAVAFWATGSGNAVKPTSSVAYS
jgi:hypothetical protein